jgi:hypothetical protein
MRDLRSRLHQWEASFVGDPLTAHHAGLLARYLAGLRRLVDAQQERAHGILVAALALGPRSAGLPGAGDLSPLLHAAAAAPLSDPLHLAIAWGSGWQRSIVPGHLWHARWETAVLSLSHLVRGPINRTVRWLDDHVPGFRGALPHHERRERLTSYADLLAMELAHDSSDRPQHRLSTWRPHACSLHAFVALAVRGSPRLPLRSGAFASSMLAALLREDQLLRVDVAEFRVCHVCNRDLLPVSRQHRRIELSSVRRGLYDVPTCPDCGTPHDPARTYHLPRKHWLIVTDGHGPYQHVRRHRCPHCGNLFPSALDRCPLCRGGAPRSARLTSVWTRLGGKRVPLPS